MRARLGTAVMAVGVLLLAYADGTYFQLTPGSQTVLPAPPALLRATATAAAGQGDSLASPSPALAALVPTAPPAASPTPRPSPTAAPTVAPNAPPVIAPATATSPPPTAVPTPAPPTATPVPTVPPGEPVSLAIPKIHLETAVKQAGIGTDNAGQPIWETLPYVAAHYEVTGPVGAPGNPVIAGHVVTLYEGNVFRNLYLLDFGDRIEVRTDAEFTYQVEDIKLVDPSDTSVMQPSPAAHLTLITCGGTFDRHTRTFDKRLIVVGTLVGSQALGDNATVGLGTVLAPSAREG